VVAGAVEVSAGVCVGWSKPQERVLLQDKAKVRLIFHLHSPIPLHCQEVFFQTYQADGNNYIPNPNAL
jgi:hypothetical protein